MPTGVQIGDVTGDDGTRLGLLTFHTDEGEISFYITKRASDVLPEAVETLRLLLSQGNIA